MVRGTDGVRSSVQDYGGERRSQSKDAGVFVARVGDAAHALHRMLPQGRERKHRERISQEVSVVRGTRFIFPARDMIPNLFPFGVSRDPRSYECPQIATPLVPDLTQSTSNIVCVIRFFSRFSRPSCIFYFPQSKSSPPLSPP